MLYIYMYIYTWFLSPDSILALQLDPLGRRLQLPIDSEGHGIGRPNSLKLGIDREIDKQIERRWTEE